MKRNCNSKMTVLTTALLLLYCNALCFSQKYPSGDLKPGKHAVGFKHFEQYDHSRTYGKKYDANHNTIRTENPRPVQIAVWYPSKAKGAFMKYQEYVALDAYKEHFPIDKKTAEEETISNYRTMYQDPEVDKLMTETLNLPTTARKNAPALKGSYPLILVATREWRGVNINTSIYEHLASQGFIVAVSPSKADNPASPNANLPARFNAENLADLQFTKAFMSNFPNVDMSKVGVMGYANVGGLKAMELAENDDNISAIAFLDSFNLSMLDIKVPTIYFESIDQAGGSDPENIKYGDLHYIKFKNMNHLGFGQYFNLTWMKPSAEKEQYNHNIEGYDLVNHYLSQFFMAYLNSNEPALEELKSVTRDKEMPSQVDSVNFSKGHHPPPANYYFIQLALDDTEQAFTLFEDFKEFGHTFFTLSDMDNILSDLQSQNRVQDQGLALTMATATYPNNYFYLTSQGQWLFSQGKYDEAKTNLEKVLRLNPDPQKTQEVLQILKNIDSNYTYQPKKSKVTTANRPFLGTWSGQLFTSNQNYDIGMVVSDNSGELQATFSLTSNQEREVGELTLDNGELFFTLPSIPGGWFEGTFDATNGEITGFLVRNGKAKFSLKKQ